MLKRAAYLGNLAVYGVYEEYLGDGFHNWYLGDGGSLTIFIIFGSQDFRVSPH